MYYVIFTLLCIDLIILRDHRGPITTFMACSMKFDLSILVSPDSESNRITTMCRRLYRYCQMKALMMTSSNGNIFRVTRPLCGEVTGHCEFPTQRPVTRSFDIFFDLRPNKRLSKQSGGWWFETPSPPLWRHCNATIGKLNQIAFMLRYDNRIVPVNQSNGCQRCPYISVSSIPLAILRRYM